MVAAGAVAGVLGAPVASIASGSPTAAVVLLLGVPMMLVSFALAWPCISRDASRLHCRH